MSGYSVAKQADTFAIRRDGKVLKTPAGKDFAVPTEKLAEAIAGEWNTQDPKKPKPAEMPLTQLAATAIDIIPAKRGAIVDDLGNFVHSELLCHLAEEPPELTARQVKTWQPLLDWCAAEFGTSLKTGAGIMPVEQSPEAVAAVHKAIAGTDDFTLAGLQVATQAGGSLILGLALMKGRLKAEEVFSAAEVDALFQIEKWGSDPAADARHDNIRCELAACEQWFGFLQAARATS